MKRFVAQLNDTSFVNVVADRMKLEDNALCIYAGDQLVAYLDTSCVLCAHLSERGAQIDGRQVGV